jgi:hypothetical protein
MTETQKRAFLVALLTVIGTTSFNATHFVLTHSASLPAAVASSSIEQTLSTTDKLTKTSTIETGAVPEDLLAAPIIDEGNSAEVLVTWSGSAGPTSGYSIYRATGDSISEYILLKNVSANVTDITDTDVTSGNTYFYKVKAWDSALSEASNEAFIDPAVSFESDTDTTFGDF